jgi:hypothetical protein
MSRVAKPGHDDDGRDRRVTLRRRRFLAWTSAPAVAGLAVGAAGLPSSAPSRVAGDLDVKSFGARGDGIADDTVAIQAALDAAASVGGAKVRVPPGRYSTRTLVIDTGVHLDGSGIEATILVLRPGTDGDLIRSRGFDELNGSNRNVGPYNFSIGNLTLDGHRARNARGCGLRLYAFGYLLRDLRIRQCAETGLWSEWSTEDPPWSADGLGSPGDSMEAQVVNLKVHHCGAGGIRFRGPHDSQFLHCIVYDTTTHGIHIEQGERHSATGCQFVNCHVWGSHLYAWKIESGFITLDACVGEWARAAQVHVNSDDATIVAGRFFGRSQLRHVGIEIGTAEVPVYGTLIDARMADLTGGAFKFSGEGGSAQIKALIYQTSGVAYTGTPARNTRLELTVNGIAEGSSTVLARGALGWNGGTPIVRHLSGTTAWTPPALAQGAVASTTVPVPGAALGDTVAVGHSRGVPAGALLVGSVNAADTVTVTLLNLTGRPLRLAAGTLRADCWVH